MYVTRRLSHLNQSPEAVAAPPDGPNSGYLVIQEEESEQTSCFGLCKKELQHLPFPQNKELQTRYLISTGTTTYVQVDSVFLIPCLDQPLSSDRYYAIVPHGKHIGEAFTCSTEGDKVTCCFCRCVKDVKSRPLDPHNAYQQFRMVQYKACCTGPGNFFADSVAPDGFPPSFLRQKGWTICAMDAKNCKLDTAEGVNSKIRSDFLNLPPSLEESWVVGKWYCPFVFVKEGTLRDQVKKSLYYEMTLEQRWEKIFGCSRRNSDQNRVEIDTLVEKEEAFIDGIKVPWNETDGVIWFGTEKKGVGLRVEVVRRMKWEEERFSYRSGEEDQVKIKRVEGYNGDGEWSEFGSYVLVERFNLKRMDGSSVMCYDFKHLDKIKNKWE